VKVHWVVRRLDLDDLGLDWLFLVWQGSVLDGATDLLHGSIDHWLESLALSDGQETEVVVGGKTRVDGQTRVQARADSETRSQTKTGTKGKAGAQADSVNSETGTQAEAGANSQTRVKTRVQSIALSLLETDQGNLLWGQGQGGTIASGAVARAIVRARVAGTIVGGIWTG
jgi:hypothetical protein